MNFLSISLNLFADGGTLMMSLILICLLLSIFFLIKGFISLTKNDLVSKKMLKLAADSSLLGLVVGFFSSILGLIAAFDALEAVGNVDPAVFASGLKISLLTATFGLLNFIIARIGIIILRAMQKA